MYKIVNIFLCLMYLNCYAKIELMKITVALFPGSSPFFLLHVDRKAGEEPENEVRLLATTTVANIICMQAYEHKILGKEKHAEKKLHS